jgi:proline iminopeptidase
MLHPLLEPFAHGLLRVADGSAIYWETSGNPEGKPALYLHGGPGSGLGPGGYRRRYDPQRHLIVGIDQRGCGRSRPLVIDSVDRLNRNNTQTLIGDIEEVRTHLGIDRWLVSGVSWGTTLALAYAQAQPTRVTELVLVAVTTTSREEVDWITETVGRIFPEAWHRFEQASARRPGERVVEAYARRLAGGDLGDRAQAADAWDQWESVHVSLDPLWTPGALHENPIQRAIFATLVTHYWANDAFLTGGNEVLSRMAAISHIPAVLIHGRHDVSGPAITAWRLHEQWPSSRLVIIESEGHGGPKAMNEMWARNRLIHPPISAR